MTATWVPRGLVTESEESGSDATSSEEDPELVKEGDAGTELWWIKEEEQGDEQGDDLESADDDDESSNLADDQAIPAAHHVGRRRRNATGKGTAHPGTNTFHPRPLIRRQRTRVGSGHSGAIVSPLPPITAKRPHHLTHHDTNT